MRHTPPYNQQFRYTVRDEGIGQNVLDFFTERFSFKPSAYWQQLIAAGDISVNRQGIEGDYLLKEGDVIHTIRRDVQEPDVSDDIQVLYNKQDVLVINKPAPLPVHPAGRYYKNTLTFILKEQNPGVTFHTIHRLDTWTTGVLILATEKQAARHIHMQVEEQSLKKTYGVLAYGEFGDKPFTVDLPVGRVDGAHRGTGPEITEAKEAVTEFVPLCKNGKVTFLKAIPVTGRTNQIRVHIQAVGGAVVNDPLYSGAFGHDNDHTVPPFMGLHCREMVLSFHQHTAIQSVVAPWPASYHHFFTAEEIALFDTQLCR